jgi:hypothetical protein
MAKKVNDQERLTEMLTLVLTPSMRAHLDHAARVRGNLPYAFPVREALQRWLTSDDPLPEDEIRRLTVLWLANKATSNREDGHS